MSLHHDPYGLASPVDPCVDSPEKIAAFLVAIARETWRRRQEPLLEERLLCVEEAQDALLGILPTRAARERAKRDPLGPYVLNDWIARP
jgi:hypothetical protein